MLWIKTHSGEHSDYVRLCVHAFIQAGADEDDSKVMLVDAFAAAVAEFPQAADEV